jgi:hypothetical protein
MTDSPQTNRHNAAVHDRAEALRFAAVGVALRTLIRLAATAPAASLQLEAARLIVEYDARRRELGANAADGEAVELTERNLSLALEAARLGETTG